MKFNEDFMGGVIHSAQAVRRFADNPLCNRDEKRVLIQAAESLELAVSILQGGAKNEVSDKNEPDWNMHDSGRCY